MSEQMSGDGWAERLVELGAFSSEALVQAFRQVPRWCFLPIDQRQYAGLNRSLPIPSGQQNSKPETVAMMLKQLDAKPGDKALDIGAGSGWTTGLLKVLVGLRGSVIGTEIRPDLVHFANSNLVRCGIPATRVVHTPHTVGLPDAEPFQRILVSARMPKNWLRGLVEQLDPNGGRLVAPVSDMAGYEAGGNTQDITVITRYADHATVHVADRGYHFVPLLECLPAES